MTKFLQKILLYFGIMLVLILVLNYRYEQTMPPNYGDKFYSVPEKIEFFNLGSSHGLCDFCYDNIKEKSQCFNFGMQSQTLSYDYRMLQQYDENLVRGGYGFIVVSYFSLFMKEESQDDFLAKNARYYKFMKPEYIKQYNPIIDLCVRYFPVLSSNENPFSILMKKSNKKNQFEMDWQRIVNSDDIKEDAKVAVERHVFSYENEGKWKVNEEEVNALKDIIIFCQERDIKSIIILPPYTDEYNKNIPQEFKEYFINILNVVSKEYGVNYCDYTRDERFVKNYECFMNSDHLNRTGAIKFTEILWEEEIDPFLKTYKK